jgi:hypothetical protein
MSKEADLERIAKDNKARMERLNQRYTERKNSENFLQTITFIPIAIGYVVAWNDRP